MSELKNQLESILFISHKPLSAKELSKLSGGSAEQVKIALDELFSEYQSKNGGVKLSVLDDAYQLVTSSDSSEIVKKFLKSELTGELTRPSLETLTIVAYRGPISKAELEMIRGVNCSLILRNLQMRGLVEAKEDSRRGQLFQITFDFLNFLGLSRLEDLPDYQKLNHNNNLEKLLAGLEANNNPEK